MKNHPVMFLGILIVSVLAMVFLARGQETPVRKSLLRAQTIVPVGTLSYNFNKASGLRNTCISNEKEGRGNLLACEIGLPANAQGGIVAVEFTCKPENSAPCQHTWECPANGTCGNHPYPTEPHNLSIDKPRSLTWYGWTDDGNNVNLHFEVTYQ